jgi:hypothetical protein
MTRDDDLLGTVKLFAGVVFLTAAWIIEATVAGIVWGVGWALPTFVLGVATGYVALRFEEWLREAAEAVRHVSLRAFRFRTAQKLVERRRALAETVARAFDEAR